MCTSVAAGTLPKLLHSKQLGFQPLLSLTGKEGEPRGTTGHSISTEGENHCYSYFGKPAPSRFLTSGTWVDAAHCCCSVYGSAALLCSKKRKRKKRWYEREKETERETCLNLLCHPESKALLLSRAECLLTKSSPKSPLSKQLSGSDPI